MQEMPTLPSVPYRTYISTLQAWCHANRVMLRITGICLVLVIGCGWYVYVSREEVRSQLQSWLVNDQVHAMQNSDTKLSAQARSLESRIAQLESGLTGLNAQFADDRTQTVDLQDQLKDTTASLQGTTTAKPSTSPKPSTPVVSPKSSQADPGTPAVEVSSAATGTDASTTGSKININTATVDQLDSLPGIGATYAQRIVEFRQQNGAFTSVDDLLKVKGIGTSMLSKIRDLVEL